MLLRLVILILISATVAGSTFNFDSESNACLTCHDTDPELFDIDGSYNSHVVGVPYQRINILSELTPKNELSQEIALVNDMVSCISCHDASADLHGILTTTNEYSNLCFQCHKL